MDYKVNELNDFFRQFLMRGGGYLVLSENQGSVHMVFYVM